MPLCIITGNTLNPRSSIKVLESDDRKKPYRLTDAGREYLSNQIKDIQAITTLGAKRLGLI